jgi:hypothetical protein
MPPIVIGLRETRRRADKPRGAARVRSAGTPTAAGEAMNRALISSTLIAAFALVACDNRPPAVVNVPAPAPGPAGPAGPQGDPGKPGTTNVIVTPPAAASAASN